MGDDLTDLVDLSGGKAEPGEDIPCDWRPFYLLVLAQGAALCLFGQRDTDIVEDGRGDYDRPVAAFGFQETFGVSGDLEGVLDPP